MGDFPTMTDQGTFIINGAERVVVSQLVRSPGVVLHRRRGPGHRAACSSARKVDPEPGRLAGVRDRTRDTSSTVKVDRKRKIAATTLLRAVG
ncbi:MAG: hypothetical protein WKF78_03345 [Candidatus Limnocylindrales bacterium]